MYDIEIRENCTRCGACVAVCPSRVFARDSSVHVVNPGGCILCGHCVAVCPVDAVLHHGFDGREFSLISNGAGVEIDQLSGFVRSRRSIREFRDKPLPRETLEQLLNLARYAPTASNAQGVRYLVITDRARLNAISQKFVRWLALAVKLTRLPGVPALLRRVLGQGRASAYLSSLPEMLSAAERGRDPVLYNAPALIVTHAHRGNAFGFEDNAYATYQLALAAHAMRLGTCMIGFLTTACRFDRAMRRLVGVPRGHRVTTAIVVGVPIYQYRRLVPRKPAKARWLDSANEPPAGAGR